MGLINPNVGTIISGSTALLISIAILITNEHISKLKIRYTKLIDWIKVITLLYEKTLKQSRVDRKNDEKEALELKKIYNHYIDRRKEFMKNTQFRVEYVFDEVSNKGNFDQDQITKFSFFSESKVSINIKIIFNVFKPRKKKMLILNTLLQLNMDKNFC